MHFDQRTHRTLSEVGLSTDQIREASERIVDATEEDANELEQFFSGLDIVYSDMDRAHSTSEYPEHEIEYLDVFTHADDIRGYLRFSTWGVSIEGGRVLGEHAVELSLGPTVDGRVRFADSREALR